MTTTYDAIIIGAGQAGPFLAQRLAASRNKHLGPDYQRLERLSD
jgi:cation diffusion facilitator CzcD-associated flavoprotein CzcO